MINYFYVFSSIVVFIIGVIVLIGSFTLPDKRWDPLERKMVPYTMYESLFMFFLSIGILTFDVSLVTKIFKV